MARTDNLSNYLADIALSIKVKKGDETPILASQFDYEITNLPTGSTHDWEAIGFADEPKTIENIYDYSLDLKNNWDATITNMSSKFYNNYSLVIFPLVDTSNVTNMNNCFQNCYSLQEIALINTSNVTNMNNCFQNCYSLIKIPLIDTSSVLSFQNMFRNCYNLKEIPQFNTSNVTIFSNAFYGCSSLKGIPLIDTSKSTTFNITFRDCINLETVPQLSTEKALDVNNIFLNCPKLTDTSLNNILKMCININPSYSRTKSLATLGFSATNYPTSRIQALSEYQNFVNAGWSIGY